MKREATVLACATLLASYWLTGCRKQAMADEAWAASPPVAVPLPDAVEDGDRTGPAATGLADKGVFDELTGQVVLGLVAGLDPAKSSLVADRENHTLTLYSGAVAVKTYAATTELVAGTQGAFGDLEEQLGLSGKDSAELAGATWPGTPVTVLTGPHDRDADLDGIPDQVDVLVGALKCAINGASYDGGFAKIAYPLGDVDPHKGCCTDVVIRSMRNAGLDLQELIHGDILARPWAYPHVDEPSTHIDHRRVKNMVVYMRKHMDALCTDAMDATCRFMPGDVVFFDTLAKKGPDHVGIVSWETDDAGLLMVINNWTTGHTTAPMDLLSWCPVTDHLRLK